jgi:hypothetical protein
VAHQVPFIWPSPAAHIISNTQIFFESFLGWTERAGDENDPARDEEGRQPGREGMSQLRKKVPVMTDRESLRRESVRLYLVWNGTPRCPYTPYVTRRRVKGNSLI